MHTLFGFSKSGTEESESPWLGDLAIAHIKKPQFFSRKQRLTNVFQAPKVTAKILIIIFGIIAFFGVINYVGVFSCDENTSEHSITLERDNPSNVRISGIAYKTNASSVLCKSGIPSWLSNKVSSDLYSNLLNIHIGIGGVIVALLIFIAESMREGSSIRSKVLIKDSRIFLLIILEITSLLLLPYLRWIILLPDLLLVSTGLLAMWSMYRTLLIFYDKKHYQRERKLYFLSLFDQVLQISVLERVARNILMGKINKKELPFGTTLFSMDDKDEYYRFSFSKEGIVRDINLERLSSLTLSLYNRKPLSSHVDSSETTEIITRQEKPKVLLAKSVCDAVKISKGDTDDKTALFIHRSLIDSYGDEKNNEIAKIEKMVQTEGGIFKITHENSPEEEWEIVFAELKRLTREAIKNKREEDVVEAIEIYLALANEFTDELQKVSNLKYDFSGALKERQSGWFFSWGVIQALKDDALDLVLDAIETKDIKIIGAVVYLSVLIVKDSIKKQDHYLFQEFVGVPTMLYTLSRKQDVEEVKDFLFDRSWRYLKEICEYYIVPELRRKSGQALEHYKSFSVYFIRVFQGLLKSSLDEKDLESFRHYLNTTYDLFERLDLPKTENDMKMVEWQLEKNPTPEKKIELDSQMQRLNTYIEIRDARLIMIFGVAAWAHALWTPDNQQVYRPFLEALQSKILAKGANDTDKIFALSELFLKAQEADDSFWGWQWWDSIPDGKVRSVNRHGNFEHFYLVELLILAEKSKEETKKETAIAAASKLPASQTFEVMAKENGSFMNMLNAMRDQTQIAPSLDSISESSIAAVRIFLETAKKRWEEEEEKRAIETHTSPLKISKFKDEIIESFYKTAKLRKIFAYFTNFVSKTSELPANMPNNRFGINIVGDKEVFFDEWHVSYFDWGDSYGNDMAQGEDTEVFRQLRDMCEDGALANINEFLSHFANPKDVIIIAANSTLYDSFEGNKNFVTQWKEAREIDIESYAGHYKFQGVKIPVFSIFTQFQQEEVLILSKNSMGNFVQYSPVNEGEENEQIDIFMMRIRAFSEHADLLEEFLKNPPQWLTKISNYPDAQMKHLLRRALIQIYQRFRWESGEDFKGYRLS